MDVHIACMVSSFRIANVAILWYRGVSNSVFIVLKFVLRPKAVFWFFCEVNGHVQNLIYEMKLLKKVFIDIIYDITYF